MTLEQYKEAIKSLTWDELETHLYEMFTSSKVFKDIESSYWSEEYNEKLLTDMRKRLEKVFWKRQFSMNECKAVLNDFLSRTADGKTKALMHLAFAFEATGLSAACGDFGEKFYDSLESSARKFLGYAKLHPDFFVLHETEFNDLISASGELGYGVPEDLESMMDDVRIKLGYYDGTDDGE